MKQFLIKKSIAAVVALVFLSVLCFSASSPLPNLTDNKEVLSNLEKDDLTEEKKIESTGNMIAKEGQKKSKKKFPVMLVLLGAAAVAVLVAVLTKKKDNTNANDTGSIKINSTPSDAEIWLDDRDTDQKTNSTLTNITPGLHTLVLKRHGYDNYFLDVTVTSGNKTTVNATLVEFVSTITWVKIPAGEFMMGDDSSEADSDEAPVHKVNLDEYHMSKYEVTFAQYDKYCESNNLTKPEDDGWGRGNRPVIHVDAQAAEGYCLWLSQKTGHNVHLPSEAQWEKAARGTDQRKYPWGNSPPDSGKCNFDSNLKKTRVVGSYPNGVSPYGIHDMAGNVWEWCSDYYDEDYYSTSPVNNPPGAATGALRIRRGGGWFDGTLVVRSTNRYTRYHAPRYNNFGFRVVRD